MAGKFYNSMKTIFIVTMIILTACSLSCDKFVNDITIDAEDGDDDDHYTSIQVNNNTDLDFIRIEEIEEITNYAWQGNIPQGGSMTIDVAFLGKEYQKKLVFRIPSSGNEVNTPDFIINAENGDSIFLEFMGSNGTYDVIAYLDGAVVSIDSTGKPCSIRFKVYTIETFPNGGGFDGQTNIKLLDSTYNKLTEAWGSFSYSKLVYQLISGETYYIQVIDDTSGHGGYYSILVNIGFNLGGGSSSVTPALVGPEEPNNDVSHATPISEGVIFDACLSPGTESDYYVITIP